MNLHRSTALSGVFPLKLAASALLIVLLAAGASANAQKANPDGNGGPGWVQTETSLGTSGSPSIYLTSVTFNVTVVPGSCANGVEATVYDNGAWLGTVTLNSEGMGSLTTSSLAVGSYSITASFPGNIVNGTTCLSSTSNTVNQVVSSRTGYEGLLFPKFVVLDVIYAPPGSKSNVQYTNATSVGNTSTNSSSFSNDIGYSIQVTDQIGIPSGTTGSDGSVTLKATQSTDYTQAQNSSYSVTLNKTASLSHTTSGYATSNPPSGPPPPGLANDWDQIVVWLNPELDFTAYPDDGSASAVVQWGGYAWDPGICTGTPPNQTCTAYGIDYYQFHVGCLNGDFPVTPPNPPNTPPSMCRNEQQVAQPSWAQQEGQMSPTTGAPFGSATCPAQNGSTSAICFNTQDAWDILYADALAYNPDPNAQPYTYLDNPQQLPPTTADGRYTQFCWNGTQPDGYPCPNPLNYEQTDSTAFTLGQMSTEQQSSGGSSQVKAGVSVSETVSTGFLGLFGQSTTYTESDTVIQTTTWLTSLSSTQTVQDAFTITADSPNWGPGQYAVYQDNWYGTFLLVPYE